MINVLELFAGSRSIGKVCQDQGWNVFSVDWKKYENINLAIDIEYLTIQHIPFIPDYIHLSPDCTTYSIAALSTHRNGIEPKSDYAKKCDRVNKIAIDLVHHYLKINSKLIYTIENPRGMLRKMPFMKGLPRKTVWYCRYGDKRAKPTDIWSNNIKTLFNLDGWDPKPVCFNNNKNCHHDKCPRGTTNSGTQGLSNSYNKSTIPKNLCLEIIESIKRIT
jgi:site-specific DNA-cytosine methylase